MSSPNDRVQLNFCIYPTLLSSHPLFSPTERCARVEPPQAMDIRALATHSKKAPGPRQVIADIRSARLTASRMCEAEVGEGAWFTADAANLYPPASAFRFRHLR
jgi:hypothetical protein